MIILVMGSRLLAEAEDEFQCFKERCRHHNDLDEEIEKYAKERYGKENQFVFPKSQIQADASNDQQTD
jgi:hypothetical protein